MGSSLLSLMGLDNESEPVLGEDRVEWEFLEIVDDEWADYEGETCERGTAAAPSSSNSDIPMGMELISHNARQLTPTYVTYKN